MMRNAIFASILVLGTAGAAGAQAIHENSAPTLVPAGAGNVVGGGAARLVGGGADSMVQRETAGLAQRGRSAQFGPAGGGGEAEITYIEPIPAGAHGRDARLLGGGDDAMIVYFDTLPARRG